MIACRAALDVPGELAQFVAELLAAQRCRRGTPRGSRALACFWQAVPGLRWFRDRAAPGALARDQDRRHRPCRPRPHPLRARPHPVKFVIPQPGGSGPGRSRLKQPLDYHPPGEHTQVHA